MKKYILTCFSIMFLSLLNISYLYADNSHLKLNGEVDSGSDGSRDRISPHQVVFTHNGKYAYAPNYADCRPPTDNVCTISQYSVDPNTKMLVRLSPNTVDTGEHPISIAISNDDKTLYVVNFDSNNIGVYSIGTDGQLTVQGENIDAGGDPSNIILSKNGTDAYVGTEEYQHQDNVILHYTFKSDGSLTFKNLVTSVDNLTSIYSSQDTHFIFSLAPAEIGVHRVNDSGELGATTSLYSNSTSKVLLQSMAVTPDNKYLFVTDVTNYKLRVFSFNSDTLKLTENTDYEQTTKDAPNTVFVSPNGKYLVVTYITSNQVSLYSIGASGELSNLGEYTYPNSGDVPFGVNFNPIDNNYLYITNLNAGNIGSFQLIGI